LLGHSRISTTQIYAKVIERKVSDDIMMLKTKLIENNIKSSFHNHKNKTQKL